jgi:hypothetical protein
MCSTTSGSLRRPATPTVTPWPSSRPSPDHPSVAVARDNLARVLAALLGRAVHGWLSPGPPHQHASPSLYGAARPVSISETRTQLVRPQSDQARRSGRPAGSASTLKPWQVTEIGADVQQVRRLGPNSSGEELSPSAVDDCALGLLVDQPLAATLPTPAACLKV